MKLIFEFPIKNSAKEIDLSINTRGFSGISYLSNLAWYINLIFRISLMIIFVIFFFLILITFFYLYRFKKSKLPNNFFYSPEFKEKYNPDLNTNNWDLHKNRLKKFGRSQYKGLTFFVSSENRIYYLSEEGDKVYC